MGKQFVAKFKHDETSLKTAVSYERTKNQVKQIANFCCCPQLFMS